GEDKMLAQDTYTGALYEVPDSSYAEVPYDGLGFALPGIGNLIGGLIPGVGKLIGGLFGGGGRPPGLPIPLPGLPSIPGLPGLPSIPGLPGLPSIPNLGNIFGQMAGRLFGGGGARPPLLGGLLWPEQIRALTQRFRPPMPFRPPWPMGWIRPQLPYTGLGPRRLYMRCAVWPGPRGLVPAHAATMAPVPAPVPPGVMPG